jgi:hypothetical protein
MWARALLFLLLGGCASCPRPVVGLGEPEALDPRLGLPEKGSADMRALLDEPRPRHCQMVFEPAFSFAHAVWFVQDDPRSEAQVIVRVDTRTGLQSFDARLDRGTASRLSRLCLAALTSSLESCATLGMDGTWYHFASPAPDGGYVMATFWSPRRDTFADAVVELAEALRDYAAIPPLLRYGAWGRIQEAEDVLSKRLAP